MAFVVDAPGKAKAAPGGKLFDGNTVPSSGGGAAALRRDLEQATGVSVPGGTPQQWTPPTTENLTNQLETGARTIPRVQSSEVQRQPRAIPQVQTASVRTPVAVPTFVHQQPRQQPQAKQQVGVMTPATSPSGVASSPGLAVSTTKPDAMDEVIDKLIPSYGADDQSNAIYEDYFAKAGMPQEDIDAIGERGSWFDVHMGNPTTMAAVEDIGRNPFLDIDINSLRDEAPKLGASLREGRLPDADVPDRYKSDTSSTIGDIYAVDDGQTMDYDHLTADHVTGEAMQRYGELGMGGRDWWEYDPYANYLKSDEQQDFGFRPYLPDQTSRANLMMSQALDAPSDIAGAVGRSRELAPFNDYTIKLDADGDPDTKDDISISGSDWDFRATPYVNNMRKMLSNEPQTFLSMPKDGKVHGAPVSTMVLEHSLPDADGTTRYVYGELVDSGHDLNLTYGDGQTVSVPESEYDKWSTDENGSIVVPDEYSGDIVGTSFDDNLHLTFSDGQDVRVPESEYSKWYRPDGSMFIPDAPYVPIEQARGWLPDDLDALNEQARERGSVQDAPVLYLPDLVMDDGTRLTWNQVQKVHYDQDADDNADGVSYDFGPLGLAKPRRLSGEIVNDDMSINWSDMLNNAYDFTAGSLPISVNQFAWPLSITQGFSKSAAGIDPSKYDALTGADRYISAEPDEDGSLRPSYTQTQQIANAAGNMLVPLTEQLAGPISGHSAIEALSGEIPVNPTTRQVLGNFALGALGEGMEEIVGNVPEQLADQGEAAFGNVVTPEGKRLLDDKGNPVRDDEGNYRFTDANGNPYTYMTDEVGHIYRDRNTPMSDRLRNFLNIPDLTNAFAGGALVDTAMQFVPVVVPQLLGMPGPYGHIGSIQRDAIRRQQGLAPYVETERDRMRQENPYMDVTQGDVDIDPKFLRLFSDQVREDEE